MASPLTTLCCLTSADALTQFGLQMLTEGTNGSLQAALRAQGVIFSESDYLSEDAVRQVTSTASDLEAALKEREGDICRVNMLHRLQLLQAWCPAVSTMVSHLLRKTTC